MAVARHIPNIALIDDLIKSGLLVQSAYIGGAWVSAREGRVVDVYNPADGERVGAVPALSVDEARIAIDAASEAFDAWSNTLASERSRQLRTW